MRRATGSCSSVMSANLVPERPLECGQNEQFKEQPSPIRTNPSSLGTPWEAVVIVCATTTPVTVGWAIVHETKLIA